MLAKIRSLVYQAKMCRLFYIVLLAGLLGLSHASDTKEPSSDDETQLGKAFFGAYRTITRTGVTLTTSTVFVTCLSGSDTSKLCGGRKKREIGQQRLDEIEESRPLSLDSSISERAEDELSEGKEKLVGGVYTVWTTATTSTTVTVRYTDTATTVSVSHLCTAGSMEYPTVFCG